MARINHTFVFVTLAVMLASTGCGDAGSFEETPLEDSGRVADDTVSTDDTTLTLEDELQFACEAYCEAAKFLPARLVRGKLHRAQPAQPDPGWRPATCRLTHGAGTWGNSGKV